MLEIHRPRTKFSDMQKANLSYGKQHKHSKIQTSVENLRRCTVSRRITSEAMTVESSSRIVSINKLYVRLIVRVKESKNVEFGAKVDNILVDGISFIEKLSLNPFCEDKKEKGKVRQELDRVFPLFFGTHTANVAQLVDRIDRRARLAVA